MSAAANYYSGSYDYGDGGNIYVHLHVANIGHAMGGQPVPPSEVADIFKQRKKQALQASKKQFKTLFMNSLNKNGAALLQEVFNNDDLITELQRQIGSKFEQTLATDKMQKLMEIERSGVATNHFAQAILGNSEVKQPIKIFNTLLESLSQACDLLKNNFGGAFAAILDQGIGTIRTSSQMGEFLLNAINQFQRNNNKKLMTRLQIQQGNQIMGTINALGNALSTGLTGGGNKLTKDAIRKMIQSIFNTGFAESISAIIKATAYVSMDNTFKASLTGSTKAEIQYSDEFGNIVAKSKGESAYGKADAFFNNVQIKLNGNGSIGNNVVINMNIGISDKFYKTSFFPGLKGYQNDQSYSSGKGGSLVEALWSSFGSNLKYLYYAYNTVGHGDRSGWGIAQGALNEVILTRQIVRLFAARGGNEDFAQFMFVNGQIIPIWDIIMSTMEDLSSFQKEDKTQPVTLAITDIGKIQEATRKRKSTLEERIYNVNNAMKKAKIMAHVNLNNLTR